MMRHSGLLISIAGLFFLTIACQPPEPEEETEAPEELKSLVETATLVPTTFEQYLDLNGVTEPVTAADITPETGGRITAIDLVEGAAIEEGAVVLTVDTSTQRARIDSISVNIDQIDRDIARTKKLVDRGLASRAQLEKLEAQRSAARKSVKEIRVGNRSATTRAPISGIVVRKDVENGEFATPGMPVGRIVDISTIVVNVGLPERQIGYVFDDMPVAVEISALGESFTGTIKRIGVEANRRNRTFPLEVHIDNPNNKIRAGMRASVTLLKSKRENAIVIPRDAVLQALNGSQVFVIEDGLARAKDIELGPGMGNFVVVASGLSHGAKLVVRGQQNLVEGGAVTISNDEPCCAAQFDKLHEDRGPAFNPPVVPPPATEDETTKTGTPPGSSAQAQAPTTPKTDTKAQ